MAETTPVSVGYSQVTRKREGYVRVWKNHRGVVLNVFEFRQTLVNEYAETQLAQRLSTINGVAQVLVFGSQKYAVRIRANPDQLAAREAKPYSYVFDGLFGYLDQALASATMAPQVTGAADWHINADEPSVLDYNTNFKTAEALTGADSVNIKKNSWGGALQIGADYAINKNVFVNLDVKKVWMDTKLQVNGEDAGKIKINPWIIGVGIGTKF